MPTAPKEAAASHAAYAVAPRRFPLLRRTMRLYRALILTLLTGLAGAVLLVPLLRDPAHYLAGLRGEWTFAVALASQDPTQIAAGGVIVAALFALSWLSDHAYQREVQISPLPAALVASPAPVVAPVVAPTPLSPAPAALPATPPPPPAAAATETASSPTAPSPTTATAETHPRVFISHSHHDNQFGITLAEQLQAALGSRADVWYDAHGSPEARYEDGLLGGDRWWRRIKRELQDRGVFVVILSREAMTSPWVHDESDLAWVMRKVIVPVLAESCDIPVDLNLIHYVDYLPPRAPAAALAELVSAIELGKTRRIETEPQPLVPAGPPFDAFEQPDTFVGRADDLLWVLGRLRAGGATGITAVNGMGGIGKTTLAAVAAGKLRAEGRFAGGMILVNCAERTDPADILAAAVARFAPQGKTLSDTTPTTLAAAAKLWLDGKDALVVLDNIEPNWPVEQVVRPLRDAGATLLLTARQKLSPDAIPAGGAKMLDLLSFDEALDLFAQSYGRPAALDLTRDEEAAAGRIVHALDRHTLAVKLAGRYALDGERDLATLAGELEDPERALTLPKGEAPDAVKKMFAASFEALDADARKLFAALAAFPTNEFGRRAALALAETLDLGDAETSLNLLVLRALLEVSVNETLPAGENDRERLRLHPLLRAFAATELARWPDDGRTAAERTVAAWYARYTRSLDYLDVAANNSRAVDEANITGAIEWAHAHGEGELVAGLCDGMQQFWRDRGKTPTSLHYLPWGVAAAEKLLGERPDDGGNGDGEKSEALTAWERRADRLFWLVYNYGATLRTTGKIDEAVTYYARSRQIAQHAGARRNEAAAISSLGIVMQNRGRLDEAVRYYEQALAIDREVGDRRGEGAVLSNLGQVAQDRGRLDEAVRYYEQALAIRREVGDRQGEGVDLGSLGQVAQRRGRLDEATGYYEQALAIDREVGDRQGEGVDLAQLGLIAEAQKRWDDAEGYFRRCLAITREVQDASNAAIISGILGRFLIQHGRGQPGEGCGLLREAVRLYHEMGLSDQEDAARARLRAMGCGDGEDGEDDETAAG